MLLFLHYFSDGCRSVSLFPKTCPQPTYILVFWLVVDSPVLPLQALLRSQPGLLLWSRMHWFQSHSLSLADGAKPAAETWCRCSARSWHRRLCRSSGSALGPGCCSLPFQVWGERSAERRWWPCRPAAGEPTAERSGCFWAGFLDWGWTDNRRTTRPGWFD